MSYLKEIRLLKEHEVELEEKHMENLSKSHQYLTDFLQQQICDQQEQSQHMKLTF